MNMTTDRAGTTASGQMVPVVTEVTYLGHVSGGMVRVRLPSGDVDVMHPSCVACLR